jgi:hypothetical protein
MVQILAVKHCDHGFYPWNEFTGTFECSIFWNLNLIIIQCVNSEANKVEKDVWIVWLS